MSYFSKFPKVLYSINKEGNNAKIVPDMLSRVNCLATITNLHAYILTFLLDLLILLLSLLQLPSIKLFIFLLLFFLPLVSEWFQSIFGFFNLFFIQLDIKLSLKFLAFFLIFDFFLLSSRTNKALIFRRWSRLSISITIHPCSLSNNQSIIFIWKAICFWFVIKCKVMFFTFLRCFCLYVLLSYVYPITHSALHYAL